ncbi:hypothetical protein AB0E88_29765 [Streptomyces sp. NPDC028635]|uniref:hypothetical protein n=1 Tax=Streptomyces sp. NPDC028635 TaxID=3154800 RepID=UPI0033EF4C96
MVMDMGRDVVQDDVVELEYTLEQQDMTDAVRLMLRKHKGFVGLLYHPALGATAALIGVVLLVISPLDDLGIGIALIVWGVLMLSVPRMSAGQLRKAQQHHGVIRASVGAAGVRQVSAHADVRTGWANYGSYAESDGVFILRSPDRAGRCSVVLAKRGARTPEDVDRLRAILAANLRRV